ncbi:ABC-type transport auxiliary lipoprotein family protein [Thauera sp.]|jgi:cholesterol transport system auxiliary component|uniref:ABC-type transport auxiliary lipoprotein family protein n=1 Tax=Thauera sp. TaxID=1905334 RepID=UPI002619BE8F|nr:ABC-type transport auxiliary lipoprotein family protein [Thauera sp.]MCK6408239.1 ABC-type transport auxiliary lipoprotein family protein [Thauera sp.]
MKTLQSVRAIKGDAPRHPGAWARAALAGRVERWIGLAAFGAALLLPACSILPKAEPLEVYLLPASARGAASAPQAAPWSLRIARPAAGVHLSGQRIVVVPEDNRVSVYKGAGWSDPAPVLVRNRLLDAFRADGRVAALSSDDKQWQADFELDSELRAFQGEYRDGHPEAVVRLDARLVHTATRRIVASRTFEVRTVAADAAVPAVVQAFGDGADRLSAEVVDWTVRAASAVR